MKPRRRHRLWGMPPFGLRRRIFWSLVGAMITAGLFTLALSTFWPRNATGNGLPMTVLVMCALMSLWFASGRLAWRLVRPLDRLVEVVKRFGQGDYSARTGIPAGARDELTRVARAVDEMAERIESQMKEERQLLAVVSHEIRTPLARIRVLTELVREGQQSSLDQIDREIAEVDYIVSNLLARSRLEFGTLAKTQVFPVDAVTEALERAGLSLSLLATPGDGVQQPVLADPTMLHRAIANLIDNAQRHGAGVERVVVQSTATGVLVDVLDRGPGFEQSDAESRFQAFHPSADSGQGQGLGLGLSLVQRIIQSHGGRVWAENRPEGGARVGFELPV